MRKEEGALIYSPSDLINFIENEFITWMDRYYLEFPGEVQPDARSARTPRVDPGGGRRARATRHRRRRDVARSLRRGRTESGHSR